MLSREDLQKIIPGEAREYDVIVAGGGPAGLGAALASSGNGARTLLLEAKSFFGGEGPMGLWMPVNRLYTEGRTRGGVHRLLLDKLWSFNPPACREGLKNIVDGDGLHIHPEYLKLAAFELLEEAGCHYRLYSPVTDTLMEDDKVKGVVVTGKNELEKFYARVVIDATGDGDVAYHAGAEMVSGREEDGRFMAHTLGFSLANVDVDRFMTYIKDHHQDLMEIVKKAGQEDGYFTLSAYWFYRTTIPGVVSVNNTGTGLGRLDGTKSEDLTVSEREGLKAAVDFVNIVREKKIPGMKDCHLMRTGAHVGVRETRRIVGEYVFTLEDAKEGTEFEDRIARKYGAVDAVYLLEQMKSGCSYPYRSMLPKRLENLLVAGRCGSATHLGHAAGKSMGNMMAIGQAAGAAAALCCKTGTTPRGLNIKKLQEVLTSMGVSL